MTKEEQKEFVIAYLNSIKASMIKKIEDDKVPSNFDGFEMRHWVAVIVNHEDRLSKNNTKGRTLLQRRRRDCENDLIVKNLY